MLTIRPTLKAFNTHQNTIEVKSVSQLCLPVRKQPHPGRAQDVERRLFVFAFWDVSSSKAEEGLQVVTGLSGGVCQSGNTWEKNIQSSAKQSRNTISLNSE